MKKMFRNFRIVLPVALVVLVTAGAVFYGMPATGTETSKVGEAPVGADGNAWATRCQDVPAADGKPASKYCEAFQTLSVQQKGEDGKAGEAQRLIEFALGYADGKKVRGVMILPLGVMVEDALELEIDGKNKSSFRVRYCQPNGCFAFLTLDDSTVAKLEKGKQIVVRAKVLNGQGLEIPMSLKGFAGALEKSKAGA